MINEVLHCILGDEILKYVHNKTKSTEIYCFIKNFENPNLCVFQYIQSLTMRCNTSQ